MALSQDMDVLLLKLPWQILHIGDCRFFAKVSFTDSSYCFLLSDLSSVWCEEAAADVIQERSKELNKRLTAPISSFLSHLSHFIRPLLDSIEKTPHSLSCSRAPDRLLLHVKSRLSGLPFYWDFHCREADIRTVCRHFLQPLISMSKALDAQCQELCTLLRRKDEEIQDYQEGGAVLSRDRLRTETFDDNAFYKTFISKILNKVQRFYERWRSCEPLWMGTDKADDNAARFLQQKSAKSTLLLNPILCLKTY
ncbi:unnamed protein product [Ranitomeya imitator]|uniref:Non-homologous end-joining factor 1 n=1 Tax=Ranitomeya imitator TaxID=111125 RepID=A0ABN9L7U4_9NEOB|nr:unnamed protein product [Ranitomeya imitator]